MASGSYILRVGSWFYVGSSVRIDRRRLDHLWRLRAGMHPVAKLQSAWDRLKNGERVSVLSVEFVRPMTDKKAWRDALRAAEQRLLDRYAGNPRLCNQSMNARGPDGCVLREKRVLSPAGRAAIVAAAKGRKVSPETRGRLAEAKRGAANPKARQVRVIDPSGAETVYPSVTAAAGFFRVSQQLLDQWLRGVVAWPGTGRITRTQNRWIIPYRAEYL